MSLSKWLRRDKMWNNPKLNFFISKCNADM